MSRAVITIVSPQKMLRDQAQGLLPDGIKVYMGEDPETTVITGKREAVYNFLVNDLKVAPEEADEYIDREAMQAAEDAESAEDVERLQSADWVAQTRAERERERYGEGVAEFDKFMDRILISEGRGAPPVHVEDNPQRLRAARHQDRPNNKIRYGAKR